MSVFSESHSCRTAGSSMVTLALSKRREEAHEILHRSLAGLVDAFHELEDIMSETVDDCDANIIVVFVLSGHTKHHKVEYRTNRVKQTEYEFS